MVVWRYLCHHIYQVENGRKRAGKPPSCFCFYISSSETGSGSERLGLGAGAENKGVRKRTNMGGKMTETVGNRELKPE